MEGPDLSHLLEDASSEKPAQAVLEGIVRRHRRLRVRRARAAATLGLVLALAGLGVGIGLNGRGAPTQAALGTNGEPTTTFNNFSRHQSSAAVPPKGLSWVKAGSRVAAPYGAEGVPSSTRSGAFSATENLVPDGSGVYCPEAVCGSVLGSFWPVSEASLTPLFTRSADGVTVRAFTAVWSAAPVEILPAGSGTGSSGSSASSGSSGQGSSVSEPPVSDTVVPGTTVPGPTASTDTTIPVSTDTTVPDTETTTTTTTALPVVGCGVTQALVAEVSDQGAVGVVVAPLGPSIAQPIDVISTELVGVAEQSPMEVVVTHTDSDVSSVEATFADGDQDQMSVTDQWAVLVDSPGSDAAKPASQEVSVEALGSDGDVLEQTSVPASGSLALPVDECAGSVLRPQAGTGGARATTSTDQAKGRGADRSGG